MVLTLKPIVEPRLTLMSVANPWIDALPEPVMSHSLRGLPTRVFSQATSFTTGASHGAAAAGGCRSPPAGPCPAEATTTMTVATEAMAARTAIVRDAREQVPAMCHPPVKSLRQP